MREEESKQDRNRRFVICAGRGLDDVVGHDPIEYTLVSARLDALRAWPHWRSAQACHGRRRTPARPAFTSASDEHGDQRGDDVEREVCRPNGRGPPGPERRHAGDDRERTAAR